MLLCAKFVPGKITSASCRVKNFRVLLTVGWPLNSKNILIAMKKLLIVLFSAVLALCAHAGVTGKFFTYRSFWPETGAMKQFAT